MNSSPEYKEVMAILKDVAESQKRAEKRLAEERQKDNERHEKAMARMEKSEKEADLRHKQLTEKTAEIDRQLDETDRQIHENSKHLGGFTTHYGKAVENEFAEALRKTKRIGEIKLDEIKVRTGKQYEFDLVAINGKVVIVGEVKFRLTDSDVLRFVKKRLPYFAQNCPKEAGNRRIYGMVGGEIMTNAAKAEAKKHGLFIARLKNKEIIIDYVNAQALH